MGVPTGALVGCCVGSFVGGAVGAVVGFTVVMGLAEGDFVEAIVGLVNGLTVLGEVEGALEVWLVVDKLVGDGVLAASAFMEEAHFGASSSEVHFGTNTNLGFAHFGAVTEEERGAPQVEILAVCDCSPRRIWGGIGVVKPWKGGRTWRGAGGGERFRARWG